MNDEQDQEIVRLSELYDGQVAEIERLRAENEAAIREVEQSTERWTTLTRARQADKTEIERFIGLNAALATEIERLRDLLREAKSLLFATQHPTMDGSEHQAVKEFLARPLGL